MTKKYYESGKVILGWIITNYLGVAAIWALIFILPFLTFIPGKLVSSLSIGLPIGFAQWIALRRVAPISILWVLTIPTGLILGLVVINSPITVGFLDFLDDESIPSLTAACMTIGLLVGLAQWIFLWGHFTMSFIWPLSSAVGLGFGVLLVLATNLIDQSGLASIILVVLVYAVVTGLVISWLPVSHRKSESNPVNVT